MYQAHLVRLLECGAVRAPFIAGLSALNLLLNGGPRNGVSFLTIKENGEGLRVRSVEGVFPAPRLAMAVFVERALAFAPPPLPRARQLTQ
jgi:hypothetical protein